MELLIIDCLDLTYSNKVYYKNKPFIGIRTWNKEKYKSFYAEYYKNGKIVFSSRSKKILSLDKFIRYINLGAFE